MNIPFAGGAYKTFSPNINAEECVNFIPSVILGQKVLQGTPGLKDWCDTSEAYGVRGLEVMANRLFAVVGETVYQIDTAGNATAATTVLTTNAGPVSMANNGTQIILVDGTAGYIITQTTGTPTVTAITDDAFPAAPTTATYQDGYFLVTTAGSGQINISDLNDGTSWDGTYYFNTEARPDDSLKLISIHRNLKILGTLTIESWYNSGATVPFDRIPGTTQEVGIGAAASATVLDNTIYFLTNTFQIARLEGNTPKLLSTPSIDYQIAQYTKKDDAIGMGIINFEGNTFYIITFPTANKTWGYNLLTNEWFQLTSYPEPFDNRWRGNCYAFFNDKHLIGDYENGKIYEWDFDTYTDNSETIQRIRVAPALRKEGKNIFHSDLQIFFESGVGLATGQGNDPQVMLSISDDGGHTWLDFPWKKVGPIGRYNWRTRWTRLGSSRQRNYKITVSDPVKWVLFDANLEARIGSV